LYDTPANGCLIESKRRRELWLEQCEGVFIHAPPLQNLSLKNAKPSRPIRICAYILLIRSLGFDLRG
jgi:hypothetical protein